MNYHILLFYVDKSGRNGNSASSLVTLLANYVYNQLLQSVFTSRQSVFSDMKYVINVNNCWERTQYILVMDGRLWLFRSGNEDQW